MGTGNVKETRRQLKTLLDRVEAGETITIARHGAVVAKLVPPANAPNACRHSRPYTVQSGRKVAH